VIEGSVIEIHEDKENLAVCKESAKRGLSDEHGTNSMISTVLNERESNVFGSETSKGSGIQRLVTYNLAGRHL
jgi:hypothetical protein